MFEILVDDFDIDELIDIVNYGMSQGVSGFIYSSDLYDAYHKHNDEIMSGLDEYCEDNQINSLEEEYDCISDDIGTAVMTNDIEFAHKIVAEYIEKFNKVYEDAKLQHAAEKYEGSDYDQG